MAGPVVPEDVTEPVRLHVAAKRYLCAVVPRYYGKLSAASVYTLAVQGGPMTTEEAAEFETLPHAGAAVAVRRWDEAAKDPVSDGPDFDHFRPLLHSLLRRHLVPVRRSGWVTAGLGQVAGWEGSRESALTATELCTVKATALPR